MTAPRPKRLTPIQMIEAKQKRAGKAPPKSTLLPAIREILERTRAAMGRYP